MDVFAAASGGDLEWVSALIEQNAALVHAVDANNGGAPLLWAAANGRVEVARYLLDHGATTNRRERYGKTALHVACHLGYTGIVLLLLQRGADVTAVDDRNVSPLMTAATEGRDAVVRLLLEHGGSDVDAADHRGWTACHRAAVKGHSAVFRQLLEAGADPLSLDAEGRTPFNFTPANTDCVRVKEDWRRAYMLHWIRSVREASLIISHSSAPVDAAPAYLVDRATSGLTMPTVHFSPYQQHGQPSGGVLQRIVGLVSSIASLWGYWRKEGDTETGEEGHAEVDPVAVGGLVTVYALEELNGEVFVELMELISITGCDL